MTLPFASERNKRLYRCFVCGIEFENYEEYKNHITKEHEEGKDYVLCPLARCNAPVRDVRSHFKVKHPKEKLPKACQMTALVWRDIKGTKKNQKKPKFKEGWYTSTKMQKKFHFRSSWEETVYQCLDLWEEVLSFDVEPFKISYLFEGTARTYVPDLLLHFTDGHKEVWEIKPSGQTSLEKNKSKWFSAKQACDTRGWKFQVITEQEINRLKKKVQVRSIF